MTKRGRPPKKQKIEVQTPPQKYNVYTDPLVQQFQKERNVKTSTMEGYWHSLKKYIPLMHWKNAEEMIQEALEDERNRVPIKEARINEHLREYLRYLQDLSTVKSAKTIHTYFTKLETFYRHYNVTVPPRPPMKQDSTYHVDYYDLPDKMMIEQAITQSNAQVGAIIYFMSSSGTAKAETLDLTVERFIRGLKEYTNIKDPKRVVQELRGRRDLVPTISMTRQKTNVPYYTCCSPEATYYILEYMFLAKRYKPDEKVFEINGSSLMKRFQDINDTNGWGYIGPYRRFRSHMLRKFHASNLGASFDLINTLEGRTNGVIHETYVKQRPDKLKENYVRYMHNVMIHPELFEGPHCGGTVGNNPVAQVNQGMSIVAPDSSSEVVPANMGQGITINGNVNIFSLDQNFIQVLNENGIGLDDLIKKMR